MNCQRIQRMFSAFVDQELSGSEQIQVQDHIRYCEACRIELESIEAVKKIASQLRPLEVSEDLLQKMMVEAVKKPDRKKEVLRSAAMATVAVACGALLGLSLLSRVNTVQIAAPGDRDDARQGEYVTDRAVYSNDYFGTNIAPTVPVSTRQ